VAHRKGLTIQSIQFECGDVSQLAELSWNYHISTR